MAPNSAIQFMHYLETNFLEITPSKPKLWIRYIDDIFIVWQHSEGLCRELMDILSNHHPTIKFTHTVHPDKIVFLDWYTDHPVNNYALDFTIILLMTNSIYIIIQHTQGNKRNQSLMVLLIRCRICSEDTSLNRKPTELSNH